MLFCDDYDFHRAIYYLVSSYVSSVSLLMLTPVPAAPISHPAPRILTGI